MGKRRQDNTREDLEDLYGEIRRLRKIVKNQQREIARLRKYEQRTDINKPEIFDFTQQKVSGTNLDKNKLQCGTCFSKNASIMDLGIKVYIMCKDCGNRKQIK